MSAQTGSKMIETWRTWEGQVVNGQFRLFQYLGGSDQSAVFLTERGADGRKAAIKLVWADPESTELQLSRWEQAAKLSHSHLVRLYEMGRCELSGSKLLYVVMDYAEEDLSQILPHRALTPAESQEMLPAVLYALAYLHAKGFVHGHLRPSNIMAVADELKISSDGITRSGEPCIGTNRRSAYDAPETATEGVSPAADVWSLGTTLVEALTQRLPTWKGTESEPAILPEPLAAPFVDIARHCLVRDPEHRYTVGQIAAHLQGISREPRKITAVAPRTPPARGRYGIGVVIAGIALLAVLAGSRWFNREPAAPASPASSAADDRQTSSATVPFSSPPAETAKAPAAPVKGAVVHQVLPNVAQSARDTIQGTVRVRVKVEVDPSGNVTDAGFDLAGPSKYFARLAMQAARDWKFRPAQVDGQDVASQWILRFGFGRSGTEVFAAQTAP
jgi:TonB family protein